MVHVAPELKLHIRPWEMALNVHEITINFCRINLSDKTQDHCNEPAWTRFVQKALEFPRLERVELLQDLYSVHEPTFFGVTDAAFKPLINARKLVCRFERRFGSSMYEQTNTVARPKTTNGPRLKTTSSGEGGGDEDGDNSAEPEKEAVRPDTRLGK